MTFFYYAFDFELPFLYTVYNGIATSGKAIHLEIKGKKYARAS